MGSRNLKRNQIMNDRSSVKRQKSKPDFDSTDGCTNPNFTPESNATNAGNDYREFAVRKNLFSREYSGSRDASRNCETNNGMEFTDIMTNKVAESDSETKLPNGHASMPSAMDSVDHCGKKIVTQMRYGYRHSYQNSRRKYSAGANKGQFQIKRKCNIGPPVSQTSSSSITCSREISNGHGADTDNCPSRYTINRYTIKHTNQIASDKQWCSRQSQVRDKNARKSDLETDDLDMDIIYATNVETEKKKSNEVPNDVPDEFARVPLQKSPGAIGRLMRAISPRTETSQVYIYHHLATDDPVLGDRFGASIETTKKRIDGYYRHIIRYVDVNGVADNMKISDGDELVLINESFVPELDHKAVLQLFSDVPVDQHTRFSLVLRRPLIDETWEWVTTSAILVPELEKAPEVRELRFERDKGSMKLFQHWYRIQIPGTQMFLIISRGEIRVQVAKGDTKDYNICVMSKCTVDPSSGDISYFACLFGVHHEEKFQNNYVHVKHSGEICLDKEPQWFGYGRTGAKMIFKVQELQKYIGCSVYDYGTVGHLCIKDDEFEFAANSVEGSYDHPDTGFESLSQPSSQRSSSSEPLSLRLSGVSDTSFSSVASSTSGSMNDSGYCRRSRSRATVDEGSRTFEDPLSESGSSEFFSVNSGLCRTPNTPMAGLSLFPTEMKPFKGT